MSELIDLMYSSKIFTPKWILLFYCVNGDTLIKKEYDTLLQHFENCLDCFSYASKLGVLILKIIL